MRGTLDANSPARGGTVPRLRLLVKKGRATAAQQQVVVVGFNRARNVQAQISELRAQGLPGNPQQAGGRLQTPCNIFQHKGQQKPVQMTVRFRVDIACRTSFSNGSIVQPSHGERSLQQHAKLKRHVMLIEGSGASGRKPCHAQVSYLLALTRRPPMSLPPPGGGTNAASIPPTGGGRANAVDFPMNAWIMTMENRP
jgi:hypothetical protein